MILSAPARLQRRHLFAATSLLTALLLLAARPAVPAAATGVVSGFSLSGQPDGSQVSFAVPADLRYHLFTLANPDRVVLDFLNARLGPGVALGAAGSALIADIRSAPRFDGGGERVVFDLRRGAKPHGTLQTADGNTQLIITFATSGAAAAAAPAKPAPTIVAASDPPPAKAEAARLQPVMTASDSQPQRLRDMVIAIDPGHGGHDSGAVGPDGLEEKNVTLAIAKDLYARLAKIPGIKPVLTRSSDRYVSLTGRREIARDDHADLFISIHADSSPYHYPKGSSVYVLSEHGASSVAARILADSENSVDQVAGVNLSDEEPMVRSTILNLSQSGTLIQSMQLARSVMDQLNDSLPMHSSKVERAAFVVLKSPDVPSILVETAFISNRSQEQELASSDFRSRIAGMIATGIEDYANHFAPPGTLIAARRDAINTLKQG